MSRWLFWLPLSWMFATVTSVSMACQCGNIPDPVNAAEYAKQVFIGEVYAVEPENDQARIDDKTVVGMQLTIVHFRVRAAIKGVSSDDLSLVTGFSTCGFDFENHRTYLVYAEEAPGLVSGRLTAKECLPNKIYESALGDLKLLRAAGFPVQTPSRH